MIFDFLDLRNQFIEVIDMPEIPQDQIVKKFDVHDNEIKNGAKLIVRPGQVAIFANGGQLADVFEEGTYELSTDNIPLLTKLKSWKYGFNSPFKADVYFVSTKQFMEKWGTKSPLIVRDAEYGSVTLRAFGTFTFYISNVEMFMRQVMGNQNNYMVEDVSELLRSTVESELKVILASLNKSILDLGQYYDDINAEMQKVLNDRYTQWGVKVKSFNVNSVSLPEELQARMNEVTGENMVKDMDKHMKFKTLDIMEDMAKNPKAPGGFTDMGMGMAMGQQMGNMMSQTVNKQQNEQQNEAVKPTKSDNTVKCPQCSSEVKKSKFCSECGAKLPVTKFCTNCGAEVEGKFCPECGTKVGE